MTFRKEALDSCQKRWMLSSSAVREREPFGAPKFARALERMPCYVACIHTYGVRWMGLRFQFPLLWLPVVQYTTTYNVEPDWWKDVVLTEGYKPPGIEIATKYDLTQLHVDHIQSNSELRRR